MKVDNEQIIYSLDIQTVAIEEKGRELSAIEIITILETISEKVN